MNERYSARDLAGMTGRLGQPRFQLGDAAFEIVDLAVGPNERRHILVTGDLLGNEGDFTPTACMPVAPPFPCREGQDAEQRAEPRDIEKGTGIGEQPVDRRGQPRHCRCSVGEEQAEDAGQRTGHSDQGAERCHTGMRTGWRDTTCLARPSRAGNLRALLFARAEAA